MNYDDWKLSNPIDDGYGYNMVSNCCGAVLYDDTDVCSDCKEHCCAIEDYEYDEIQRQNYLEMLADAKRDEG